MTGDPYDALRYEGTCVPTTAPESWVVLAQLAGFPTPRLDSARVLEIGCGDGGNLIPLAYYHPQWTCAGFDPSQQAIRSAQAGQQELGLEGLQFQLTDAASFTSDEPFDFVICHGVYSWVDSAARDSILQLARRVLTPEGLFYLSYNTEPGWRARGLVRDHLRRRNASDASNETQAESARRELALLESLLADASGHPYLELLKREIAFAQGQPLFHLGHEYLAEHNQAFWFGEIWDTAHALGLHYVGDAQDYRPEGYVSPAQRELVRTQHGERRDQEETLDLVCYRQMRTSIFSLSTPSPEIITPMEWARNSTLASALRPTTETVDLNSGVEVSFVCPRTARTIQASSPFGKAALHLLASLYPQGLTVEKLLKALEPLLGQHPNLLAAEGIEEFLAGFVELHQLAFVELRSEEGHWTVPNRGLPPRAHALARYEARHRPYLTSPAHRAVAIEPLDRMLLMMMDGTRDPETLASLAEERGCEKGAERITQLIDLVTQWGLGES